jgi:biopolymer transport protein ExbD
MDWQTSDPSQLAARLAQMRDRNYRVVIDGAANCPFRHVMSALDACVRAGITGVGFQPPSAA